MKNITIASFFSFCLFVDMAQASYTSYVSTEMLMDINEPKETSNCKFIIHDGYNSDVLFHFVDDYDLNIDGSISFLDSKGTFWNIPAPYFWIYKNNKI
jgi:hypothetical protein